MSATSLAGARPLRLIKNAPMCARYGTSARQKKRRVPPLLDEALRFRASALFFSDEDEFSYPCVLSINPVFESGHRYPCSISRHAARHDPVHRSIRRPLLFRQTRTENAEANFQEGLSTLLVSFWYTRLPPPKALSVRHINRPVSHDDKRPEAVGFHHPLPPLPHRPYR